jgi:hypothetical protein
MSKAASVSYWALVFHLLGAAWALSVVFAGQQVRLEPPSLVLGGLVSRPPFVSSTRLGKPSLVLGGPQQAAVPRQRPVGHSSRWCECVVAVVIAGRVEKLIQYRVS